MCIVAGMTATEFWDSYPCEIIPYLDAHKIRQKENDERDFAMYHYIANALSVTLNNAFRKKGSKPVKLLEKSFRDKYEEEHRVLTEDEEQAAVATLFFNLGEMQRKFENSKKEG